MIGASNSDQSVNGFGISGSNKSADLAHQGIPSRSQILDASCSSPPLASLLIRLPRFFGFDSKFPFFASMCVQRLVGASLGFLLSAVHTASSLVQTISTMEFSGSSHLKTPPILSPVQIRNGARPLLWTNHGFGLNNTRIFAEQHA